jgi:hypothetical protein
MDMVVASQADRAMEDADAVLLREVHAQAMRVSSREAADTIYRLLTGKIAAYMLGIKDVRTLTRWAAGEVREVRVEHERRLRAAYEIATLLLRFDAPETVRAWFIGMNPELDDVAPIEVIRQDRLQDALGAARAFVANG